MKLQKIIIIIIIATILLLNTLTNDAFAATVQCGDTITDDITLTEDLYCPNHDFALQVIRNNVKIDLNRHSISGIAGRETGIRIIKSDNVEITNGFIHDYGIAISAIFSNGLIIRNMKFARVGLANKVDLSDDAIIRNNIYYRLTDAITIVSSKETKGNHIIENNSFTTISQAAISVYKSRGNKIVNNVLSDINHVGIRMVKLTDTIISGNRLSDINLRSITLIDSSYNIIENNYLKGGNNGIYINAFYSSMNNFVGSSYKNIITNNDIYDHDIAIVVGYDEETTEVHDNYINYNKIYYNGIGIKFDATTYDNNATNNGYYETTTNVIDNGTGNVY